MFVVVNIFVCLLSISLCVCCCQYLCVFAIVNLFVFLLLSMYLCVCCSQFICVFVVVNVYVFSLFACLLLSI